MKTFPLHIGTPDGLLFEGNVEKVICRTITGDLAILSGHSNFCTALGMGESTVVMEDGSRRAAPAAFWPPPGNGKRTSTSPVRRKRRNTPKKCWPKEASPIKNTRSPRRNSSVRWCA